MKNVHQGSRMGLGMMMVCGAWALGTARDADAAVVSYRFSTTVNMINPSHASFPAALAGVSVGAPVVGTITYETTSPTATPIPSLPFSLATRYVLVSAKYRLVIGGVVMNSWTGQPNAFVWNDDQMSPGGPIADGLNFTNITSGSNIQMQLGNMAMPTSVLTSEALPPPRLRAAT